MKKVFVLALSLGVLGAVIFGIHQAVNSSLFLMRSIELTTSQNESPPIDRQSLVRMIGVPVNKVNLFDVDLKMIENRLLSHDWIREVRLQKKFFHTLSVYVEFREPKALMQNSQGTLSYVDQQGDVFGIVNLKRDVDLPILSGLSSQGASKVREALELTKEWETSLLGKLTPMSSVYWDPERGFRVLAVYGLGSSNAAASKRVRALVDIGQTIDESLEGKLVRLSHVIRYLVENSIAARRIWIDAGKKVVVKTAPGS